MIVVAPRSTQTAEDVIHSGAGLCAETGLELIEAIERMITTPSYPSPFAELARQAFQHAHCETAAIAEWLALLKEAETSHQLLAKTRISPLKNRDEMR